MPNPAAQPPTTASIGKTLPGFLLIGEIFRAYLSRPFALSRVEGPVLSLSKDSGQACRTVNGIHLFRGSLTN